MPAEPGSQGWMRPYQSACVQASASKQVQSCSSSVQPCWLAACTDHPSHRLQGLRLLPAKPKLSVTRTACLAWLCRKAERELELVAQDNERMFRQVGRHRR